MDSFNDYLKILNALCDIPFAVGKKLLIDYLQGNEDNESIARNGLFNHKSFGSLAYTDSEIEKILDILIVHGLIHYTTVNGKKFWKVLEITPKGRKELTNPSLVIKSKPATDFYTSLTSKVDLINENDTKMFLAFGKILDNFSDEQKKAIISNAKQILCIAGAGSGKTTVLTKRIEFLIKYKSVNPKNILAITFTRKARTEMINRLSKIDETSQVKVETFNSFCEQILKTYNDKIYDKNVRVIDYREKFLIMNKALYKLNTTMDRAVNNYFTTAQKRSKTSEQLTNIFMNDCFFIRDYTKLKKSDMTSLSKDNSSAKFVFDICKFIDAYMYTNGLRDFADQIIDTMKLFEKHPEIIPQFSHILIDEYQDVNSSQIQLIDMLNSENIFAVGDPRQSIFGWRGSDVRYLINFSEKYPDCQILMLTDNYRSTKAIVNLINASIKDMGLSDLKSSIDGETDIRLLQFNNEDAEFEFVIQKIISTNISRKEIFILARTNRQLVELSKLLHSRRISHVIRSDELKNFIEPKNDDITLATIHAIKGLEAEMVFVIGCTHINFPCKGTEHPVVELIKLEEYDKEEEEKRLFYVAMSRAKKSLYLTYNGSKHTSYITSEMQTLLDNITATKLIGNKINKLLNNTNTVGLNNSNNTGNNKEIFKYNERKFNNSSTKIISEIKHWRSVVSKREGMPAYIILHDATITDLAQKMPMSLQDLEKIHGMGPVKIKKYGEELLEIINN
ncbi:MAG: UvrD-helicase domain-containing protein [Candidatus Woesearchaeota archaeon]